MQPTEDRRIITFLELRTKFYYVMCNVMWNRNLVMSAHLCQSIVYFKRTKRIMWTSFSLGEIWGFLSDNVLNITHVCDHYALSCLCVSTVILWSYAPLLCQAWTNEAPPPESWTNHRTAQRPRVSWSPEAGPEAGTILPALASGSQSEQDQGCRRGVDNFPKQWQITCSILSTCECDSFYKPLALL